MWDHPAFLIKDKGGLSTWKGWEPKVLGELSLDKLIKSENLHFQFAPTGPPTKYLCCFASMGSTWA